VFVGRIDIEHFSSLQIMHYSVAFQSFLSYLEEDCDGGIHVLEGPEGQRVSDRLAMWARRLLRMGLDGAVLVEVLQDVGLPQIDVSESRVCSLFCAMVPGSPPHELVRVRIMH
jgi:hypothetical protein